MKYKDFNIEILASREDRFDIQVESGASGDSKATIRLKRSVDELLQIFDAAARSRAREEDRDVKRVAGTQVASTIKIGQELYEMLFSPPQINRALAECMTDAKASNAGVRLKLIMRTEDAAVADLARLPWELLQDESKYDYFGLRFEYPIVRYLRVPQASTVPAFEPPLRILVLSSNPGKDLDLERERKNLKEALGDHPKIELDFLDEATIDDVETRLATASIREHGHHIVHYMGHGGFREGKGLLLLNKSGGGIDAVDAETFHRVLTASNSVRLVFLNACNTAQSGGRGDSDAFSGVAAALVFGGVPAVVAMQRPIPDSAAINLARTFYASIAEGLPIDYAITAGRRRVHHASLGTLDWAIPVLFMRSPNGVLFDVADSTPPSAAIDSQRGNPPSASKPVPLRLIFGTDDQADQVEITTRFIDGQAGLMRICLGVAEEAGWWKGIGINNREPILEGEYGELPKCTTIRPGPIRIDFWKAKTFGIHTHVGTRELDLSSYGDHEVMFTWKKD